MVGYRLEKILAFLPELLAALPLTLGVLLVTIVIGSILGALLAWAQISGNKVWDKVAKGYIFIIRCTPPIVLLFLVFYGLPEFIDWWLQLDINGWSRATFTIIAMVLLYGATAAEIFKSSYLAVPKGQLEAGLSMGLTPFQVFERILLTQILRIALPNIGNAILTLLKEVALAYTIGLADIMGASHLLIGRNLGNYSLETYTAAALIYWGLSLLLTLVLQGVEKRLSVGVR